MIIDMQERLLSVIPERDKIIASTKKLLEFSRIIDLPTIFTEQEKLGDTVHHFGEYIKEHKPIKKFAFNCFASNLFVEQLSLLNGKSLIVAGIEAHICVLQTVLHAVRRYEVHVVRDAIASRSLIDADLAVERMRLSGAIITSTEMFIYEMLRVAGTDVFRKTLALIK